MDSFDRILIAPSRAQLLEALMQATARANQGHEVLTTLDQEHWFLVVHGIQSEAQGLRQWSDADRGETALVRLAWWTDNQSRCHFRVRGERGTGGGRGRLWRARDDRRPPIWHVYPDRIFQRCTEGSSVWVASCSCGLTDRPERLAWDGYCCGGCHDRRLDGELPGYLPHEEPRRTLIGHTGRIDALAFSADGRQLASSGDRTLQRWDLTSGRPVPDSTIPDGLVPALAFSPDGQLLAWGNDEGDLRIFDLASGEPVLLSEQSYPVSCLAFDPTSLTLAVGSRWGVQVWERAGRSAPWRLVQAVEGPASTLAFSPDGCWLASAGEGRLSLRRFPAGQPFIVVEPEPSSRWVSLALAFTPDGQRLLLVERQGPWPDHIWERGFPTFVRTFEIAATEVRVGQEQPAGSLRTAALLPADPKGSDNTPWLAGVPGPGPDGLHRLVLRPLGLNLARPPEYALGWSLDEAWKTVCFSPDGETLASGGVQGTIKLWPWRHLVELTGSSSRGT
jgi:WD40 repeat protein